MNDTKRKTQLNQITMKNILENIQALKAERLELAHYEKKLELARQDVLAITKLRMPLEEQKRRINDARLTCELMEARIETYEPRCQEIADALVQLVRNDAAAWNVLLGGIMEGIKNRLLKATLPVFNNNEAANRNFWDEGKFGQLPALNAIAYAMYRGENFRLSPTWDEEKLARHYLEWKEREGKLIGRYLLEFFGPAAVKETDKSAEKNSEPTTSESTAKKI